MNLITLDFGNSSPHAALFRRGELKEAGLASELNGWLTRHGLNLGDVQGVLCQVKAHDEVLRPLEQQGLLVDRVRDYWRGTKFAGMPVHYAATLGEDRLIAAYWAYKNLPGATLLIDAGTYLTVDVVDGAFQGGHILPGLKLLSEDLGQGEQLQSASFESIPRDLLTGATLPQETSLALTGSAIAYGALIQRMLVRHAPAQVLVSGGDAISVASWLKVLAPATPLQLKPDLIHWALLDWYQRNINP